ncbi:PucR family transcriptional regulator [Frigoribacterium sp. ACAM 257]|uniref:helix-turn-helix domain-containing protein n=1 Tax=Frigoribacterium sp. ACAM 257 TaxID=2508998 RepID=UPI0011B99D00|nr:PucR family transcriptional regulator [Frigoribacterium sp. ACAM 257]TWX40931.1 PucR family transcriptional regulator [Frigoribacterium sp. ACAM 257]
MRPTVRALVRQAPLGLRLLDPTTRTDEPLSWVHSSDLVDPSPFVAASTMLLTTGSQFRADATQGDYDAWVGRVVGAGVVALGFGAGVHRPGTPVELVLAASSRGVPVVEVPWRTPFIAVARWAADQLAEEARDRDRWTLRAQRAVSVAAIGDGGLDAVLRVLGEQLGGSVVLHGTDAPAGAGRGDAGVGGAGVVEAEVARLLRRGARAGSTVTVDDGVVSLQTLGRRDGLRGVLAVRTPGELDTAARAVLTSVVALAEVTLERDVARLRGQRELWRQVWSLLVAGQVEVARSITRSVGVGIAAGPVVVALAAPPRDSPDRAAEAVERLAAGRPDVFVALVDGTIAVLAAESAVDLPALAAAHGLRIGVSDVTDLDHLAGAAAQAERALAVATSTSSAEEAVVTWASLAAGGLVAALWSEGAAELASSRLAPVAAMPDGEELLACCRTWLEHNGAWDPAARSLGLHRHSLRARVAKVEAALGLPLDGFAGRAELWALLQAAGAGRPGAGGPGAGGPGAGGPGAGGPGAGGPGAGGPGGPGAGGGVGPR